MAKVALKSYEAIKPNDSYVRISRSMLVSKAFQSLSPGAKTLYTYMKYFSYGNSELMYPCSFAIDRDKVFKSNTTFYTAKRELVEKGFIEELRVSRTSRTPNLYKLSSKWRELE